MKRNVSQTRVEKISAISPGTVVQSTSHSYTSVFTYAMVVEDQNEDGLPGKGLLLLDGAYKLRLIRVSEDPYFLTIPTPVRAIDGIDELQPSAHSNSLGALIVWQGNPLIRADYHANQDSFGHRVYVDLVDGLVTAFQDQSPHEAYVSWSLIAVDEVLKTELVLFSGPAVG